MCLRQRRAGRVGRDRVEPERDGDRDAAVLGGQAVHASVLVDLPVHERRARVDHLHPVHADVASAVVGSFVITAGRVMKGAGSPGQQVWIG